MFFIFRSAKGTNVTSIVNTATWKFGGKKTTFSFPISSFLAETPSSYVADLALGHAARTWETLFVVNQEMPINTVGSLWLLYIAHVHVGKQVTTRV